jgi:hypothetical protein
MAPIVPYDVNDKYYMIVGYSTPRELLLNPVIHTGFHLYPTSHNKVIETLDHLSTKKRPGFTYDRAKTPDRDQVGNLFAPIAGVPDIPPDRVWIAYYAAAGSEATEQQELRKEFVDVELPRMVNDYVGRQRGGGEVVEGASGEGEMRLTRRDGVNVWFGVLDMDVVYSNPVGDTRPAPGSGK